MLFAHPHFAHCVCKLTVFAVLTHQTIPPVLHSHPSAYLFIR